MKTKHTPGPWQVGESISGKPLIVTKSHGTIAQPTGGFENEIKANARLIAAAPDLLAIVKELLICGPNAGHNQDLLTSAIEAVAKAEGKTR